MENITIDDLYTAIEQAETGDIDVGKDGMGRYIRTRVDNSGSSAFGPVQMTKGLLSGPGYSDIGFTEEEDLFIKNILIPQADNLLKYGGDDMVKGMERYDYGGRGDFTAADTSKYKDVAKKIMDFEYKRAGKDLDNFIQNWRGAPEFDVKDTSGVVIEKGDKRYYDVVKNTLSKMNPNDKVFNALSTTPNIDKIEKILDNSEK